MNEDKEMIIQIKYKRNGNDSYLSWMIDLAGDKFVSFEKRYNSCY